MTEYFVWLLMTCASAGWLWAQWSAFVEYRYNQRLGQSNRRRSESQRQLHNIIWRTRTILKAETEIFTADETAENLRVVEALERAIQNLVDARVTASAGGADLAGEPWIFPGSLNWNPLLCWLTEVERYVCEEVKHDTQHLRTRSGAELLYVSLYRPILRIPLELPELMSYKTEWQRFLYALEQMMSLKTDGTSHTRAWCDAEKRGLGTQLALKRPPLERD